MYKAVKLGKEENIRSHLASTPFQRGPSQVSVMWVLTMFDKNPLCRCYLKPLPLFVPLAGVKPFTECQTPIIKQDWC